MGRLECSMAIRSMARIAASRVTIPSCPAREAPCTNAARMCLLQMGLWLRGSLARWAMALAAFSQSLYAAFSSSSSLVRRHSWANVSSRLGWFAILVRFSSERVLTRNMAETMPSATVHSDAVMSASRRVGQQDILTVMLFASLVSANVARCCTSLFLSETEACASVWKRPAWLAIFSAVSSHARLVSAPADRRRVLSFESELVHFLSASTTTPLP
mmetsp:Transcript_34683/g.62456  ORF Transcript_34683/g.62456 Transcript_34683/m.62456 type:complete len:216 (+) Transcript_34683:323-970(+)